MITNGKKLLEHAYQNKYAIPHFNINNLEWTKYILEECNINNTPVFIGISKSTIEYMGGYKVVSTLIRNLDESLNINIPVVIHLDHGKSFEDCKNAILNGFTSVMYDGSSLNIEENVRNTKKVVELAKEYDVCVEAEVGSIGENGLSIEDLYAKVKDCIKLKETGINSLAPALGSVHGIYKKEPSLNFKRMSEINNEINLPLVLHGASGIPDNQIKEAIRNGISKININTELQISWSKAIKKFINTNDIYDPRKIISSGEKEMKKIIKEKIELLK